MRTSLLIITWNQKEKLQKCLESIYTYSWNTINELILVDNNSTDNTVEYIKNSYPEIKLIVNYKNMGVAYARNQALKECTGDLIILLDDDTIIEYDVFAEGLGYFNNNPSIGIMGPKLLFKNRDIQPSARDFPSISGILGRAFPKVTPASFKEKYFLKYISCEYPVEVDWVIGACQFIRKEVIDKIGLLDEKYFFGYEDIDFCYRTKKAGWKIIYNPKMYLIHFYQRKSKKMFSYMSFMHLFSIIKYFRKFGLKL